MIMSKQCGPFKVELLSDVGGEWFEVGVTNSAGSTREFEVRAGDHLMRQGVVKVGQLCATFPEYDTLPLCFMTYARQVVAEHLEANPA